MITRRTFVAGTAAMLAAPAVHARAAQTIVVTGHLGNVGSRLVPFLGSGNYSIRGIDKRYVDDGSFDLANVGSERWPGYLHGAETIIHLAATASPDASEEDATRNNSIATMWLLATAAFVPSVRHVIFASSTWVQPGRYGNPAGGIVPVNPYGRSKLFGEVLCEGLAASVHNDIRTTVVRIGWAPPEGTAIHRAPAWLRRLHMSTDELCRTFAYAMRSRGSRYTLIDPFAP